MDDERWMMDDVRWKREEVKGSWLKVHG